MSKFNEVLKNAIFYSKEKPELLADILETCSTTENMAKDITLDTITVPNGTELSAIKTSLLPTRVTGYTSKNIPFEVSVAWGADTTPTFAKTTAGDYVLSGTISGLPNYVTNTDSKSVKVTITVEA